MAVVPHCPVCRVETLANTASRPLPGNHYQLYYCSRCGAVYGVVPVNDIPAAQIVSPETAAPTKAPPTETPICPQHNLPLKKKTVPAGNKDAGKTFWVCPRVTECRYYREISPKPTDLDIHQLILAEVGEADLSNKEPISPERMQAKMRAARLFRPGTRYQRVAYDTGPPLCPEHNLEMEEYTLPEGCPNGGLKIWHCPWFGVSPGKQRAVDL
jgi:hypothetical protein